MRPSPIKSESEKLARDSHKQNALGSFRFLQALRLHHAVQLNNVNAQALREYQREQGYGVG